MDTYKQHNVRIAMHPVEVRYNVAANKNKHNSNNNIKIILEGSLMGNCGSSPTQELHTPDEVSPETNTVVQ